MVLHLPELGGYQVVQVRLPQEVATRKVQAVAADARARSRQAQHLAVEEAEAMAGQDHQVERVALWEALAVRLRVLLMQYLLFSHHFSHPEAEAVEEAVSLVVLVAALHRKADGVEAEVQETDLALLSQEEIRHHHREVEMVREVLHWVRRSQHSKKYKKRSRMQREEKWHHNNRVFKI